MHDALLPAGSFYGRDDERRYALRMIEQRVGGLLGFSGIGGMGKSTLLAQIAKEAHNLKVTPYIVGVTITPEMTPLGFMHALIDGLAATGKTTRRRLWVFPVDTLAKCTKLLRQLDQQEVWLSKRVQMVASASGAGHIGNVTLVLQEQGKPGDTVLLDDLVRTFRHAASHDLPVVVTVPEHVRDYVPGRLLVLLVDIIEAARPDLLHLLRTLRSGALTERCLLICAGRSEPPLPDRATSPLLTQELTGLDVPTVRVWANLAGVSDDAVRTAIADLCAGVPLLVRLAIETTLKAAAQGQPLQPNDFKLPPDADKNPALDVVEAYIVDMYIKRMDTGEPLDKQISLLLRYGCILRDFSDKDALRALEIPELVFDLDGPLRDLSQRGLMQGERLHPVIRHAALARLAHHELRTFRAMGARGAAYAAVTGRPDERLYLRLLAGEPGIAAELPGLVQQSLGAGDIAQAGRLIRAAEEAPPSELLRWNMELALTDIASAQGQRDQAEQRLAHALTLLNDDPARVAEIERRIGALEPLRNGLLLHWWLPRQLDSSEVLNRLVELSDSFRGAYQAAIAEQLARQALAMAERLDDRLGTAHALLRLGDALIQQDEPRQAQGYLEQALRAYRDIADRRGTANALRSLGDALWAQGHALQAKTMLHEARSLARQIEYRAVQFNALTTLIAIAESEGDHTAANEYRLEYQRLLAEKRR